MSASTSLRATPRVPPSPSGYVKIVICPSQLRPVLGGVLMEVERYRTQLLQKRGELLGGPAAKPLQWTMENNSGRQGDMADQASGNNEVHIQLKLKQTDAKILQAIEEALRRIDEGTFGVCRDCGAPSADARLDLIP